jgi:hypothetical protein
MGLWILQRKTPFNTLLIIPPPIRHINNLPGTKAQEDHQYIEVKPGIERRGKDIIIPRPELVMVAVSPVHDYEAADDAGHVAR